ncbi:hypothetical protein PCA31118_02433 [Pandoraea captiosa]|uniref:Uncharacterized protein n=1 Tax=Pandoraea captiosa TaxID=2508302 RepID=A0A5E5A1K7_9BURK|nr:hypothetical protein PCA31118_02433 [Pandoraea captiosa]
MRAIPRACFVICWAISGVAFAQTGQQKTQPSPDLDQMIATRIRVESPICQPLAGMVRDIATSQNPKYVKDRYMEKVMDKITKLNCWR